MEPEMSEGVVTPPSSQDADHAARVDSAVTERSAQRGARVTRALEAHETLQSETPPSVDRSAWLRDDDYWRNVTYISATGRRPGERSATRPLPPPDRFRPTSRLRSATILSLVIALMIVIPIGMLVAGNAAAHITIPTTIPGISQPTATPVSHATVTPTSTPKSKK